MRRGSLGRERPVEKEPRAQDGPDHDGDDQKGGPAAADPGFGKLDLLDDRGHRPARRCLGFGHLRAADSAIACTSPCVVYSRATMETVRPSLRATSAVTGPIDRKSVV